MFPAGKPVTFLLMVAHATNAEKFTAALVGLILLAAVGVADYLTGYKVTLLIFYLAPILFVLRHVGQGCAFIMAVLAALVWLSADFASGQRYENYLTPIWNASICLAVFLLVIILFSTRTQLKKLVAVQTENLRQEIRERTRLEAELLEIAESEQRRIGHDLHDSLVQHLTAAALAAKLLAKKMAGKTALDPAAAEHVVAMMEQAIELTQNLARSLHPLELGTDGLENALQNLAANLSKAFNVSCRFQSSGTVVLADPKAGLHLYRIAQEAASNAIRHGRARSLLISLDATRESLMLAVTDDGAGLAGDARAKKGMGLRIMDYRASIIGAAFDVQNLPGGGARAICVLNFRPKAAETYEAES